MSEPSLNYPCWPHQNGNMFAAVDLETTGTWGNVKTEDEDFDFDEDVMRVPGWHEIIQIAIVPCGPDFKPLPNFDPFYREMAPLYPEREDPQATKVHDLKVDLLAKTGRSPDDTIGDLVDWFNSLELAFERRLIPIAHNWQFEATFLKPWLGLHLFDRMFLANVRDSMAAANYINDHAVTQGRAVPFERVNLQYLSKKFGIVNLNPHDAYADAVAGAELYGKLCKMDVLV